MVVVRPPTAEAQSPTAPASGSAMLPLLLLRTGDRAEADALAARLRGEGATIVVLEELADSPTTCTWHPPQLIGRTCAECGVDICASCRVEAGGDRLCPVCAGHQRRRRRNERLRQLFAIFLFSVFLYEVVAWQREEHHRLDPADGISVAVFQFVEGDNGNHPTVAALNEADGPYSLLAVQDWYQQEYRRYTGRDHGPLAMQTFGPWPLDPATKPHLASPEASWWEQAWASYRYADGWHALARGNGADPDAWDVRVYVIYGDDPGDLAADSRGSNTGRIAVSFVSLGESNRAYAQLTVAHEIGHVLGAEDLYDPTTFLAEVPLGLAEPNRSPRFPQRYAEVMAGDRPLGPTIEAEVRSLDLVRVGYHTAARMGWIEKEQAELQYATRRDVVFGPPEAPPPAPAPPPPADGGAAAPDPAAPAPPPAP